MTKCAPIARQCVWTMRQLSGRKSCKPWFSRQSQSTTEGPISRGRKVRLKYDISPKGFGIPFQFYSDFVNFPRIKFSRSKINAFVADEKAGSSTAINAKLCWLISKVNFSKRKFHPKFSAITGRVAAVLSGAERNSSLECQCKELSLDSMAPDFITATQST